MDIQNQKELDCIKENCVNEYNMLTEEHYHFDCNALKVGIQIGRKLNEIDAYYLKNNDIQNFEINKLFLGDDGEQLISAKRRAYYRMFAKIEDIEEFIWLGGETMKHLYGIIVNLKQPMKVKNILVNMNIDMKEHNYEQSLKIRRLSRYYETYLKIHLIKSDVKFNKIADCIEKGIDFHDEYYLAKIRQCKEVNKQLESFLTTLTYEIPQKVKKQKRTIGHELENKAVLFLHAIDDAIDDENAPIHLSLENNKLVRSCLNNLTIKHSIAYKKQCKELSIDKLVDAVDDEIQKQLEL